MKKKEMKPMGIYVHIPFCEKKCDYCDFLSGPQTRQRKEQYVEQLIKEIERFQAKNDTFEVVSIFFGGGTPSSIDPTGIKRILDTIYHTFYITDTKKIEITVESNPGTLTKEKLEVYREAGVNRISMGLQSTNNKELRLLGRIHTYEQFEENYQLAKEVGFTNINVDLMSALPGQTKESYLETLEKVMKLRPSHISAYSLIIEEGTPFYEQYGEGMAGEHLLPGEDVDRFFYTETKRLLQEQGYQRYEISNYALEGQECRHNSLYWIGVDYVGFGLGASSCYEGERYHNEEELDVYIDEMIKNHDVRREITTLTIKEQMEEMMFLGLRMTKGVSESQFLSRFGASMESIYAEVIERFVKEGLLKRENERIALTEAGLDVSNYVMAEFLLEE